MKRRRSIALILTLLLVTLLATTTAQLATATSVESIVVARQHNGLQHTLAVDSAMRLIERLVVDDASISRDLDAVGSHALDLAVGTCDVRVRVTDDGAKFDVNAFADDGSERQLKRKLRRLARSVRMPMPELDIRPVVDEEALDRRIPWFDQLFDHVQPTEVFRWDDTSVDAVWSDVISCFGSGRVDLRRASLPVLSAMLDDLDRGLARRLLQDRNRNSDSKTSTVLADLAPGIQSEVQSRIGYDLQRYALSITTSIGGDTRRWYVVATINESGTDIHHRGQLQW